MTELDRAFDIAVIGNIEKATQQTAILAYGNISAATPVGDATSWKNPGSAPPGYVGGHARRNWFIDIGSANEREEPGVDPNGTSSTAAATGKALQFRIENKRMVIHNSTPYIKRLNNGHSGQAPAGFIENSVESAARQITRRYK